MVRRQTWILMAVFVVLLGVTFYLNENPLPDASSKTPSPTAPSRLLENWQSGDIQSIELEENQKEPVQVARDGQVNWVSKTSGSQVSAGAVEAVLAELTTMQVQGMLPAGYDLNAVELAVPTVVLTINGQANQKTAIKVGGMTPTGSGYYVQIDEQNPVVVSNYSLENVLEQLREINTPAADSTEPAPINAP